MKSYHHDESGMTPRDKPDQDKRKQPGGGGGGGNQMIPAFLPGQKGALAGQLNAGFGGGLKAWQQNLGATYAPFRNATMFPYAKLGDGDASGKATQASRNATTTERQSISDEEWRRLHGGRR